jgi:formylglycine-generating enzyme required for sulfatase activity
MNETLNRIKRVLFMCLKKYNSALIVSLTLIQLTFSGCEQKENNISAAKPTLQYASPYDNNNTKSSPDEQTIKTDAAGAEKTPEKGLKQSKVTQEDTKIFKEMRIAEILCESHPKAKTDPNTPEPNNAGWYVKIDGQPGPGYDGIGEMALSPQADHIAYAARKGSKFHLIVNGKTPSLEFDNIQYITYSPDGNHLAFGAKTGEKWFAVLDGNAGPGYDFVGNFVFSPDSRHFAHTAIKQNGKKQTVVLDGVEICPLYDLIRLPVFSNNSKRMAFMAEDNLKSFIVIDGKPDETYDRTAEPAFSPDSQHYAYFAEKGNYRFLVFDGVAGTPFEYMPKRDVPVFGPNDNRVAYRADLEDNWFVAVDGQIGPFFDGIVDRSIVLSADGKSCAYAAKQGEDWCVVVNDQNGPFYDGIAADGPVFSPDGKHLAYGAYNHGKYFMVMDGQPVPGYNNYNDIGNNSILFSPDSSHLVYKAKKGTNWHMAADGQLGPAYDKLKFKPTITENAIEYLAERDGWLFRCRRLFEGQGINKIGPEAETPDSRPAAEKAVTVNEQRLMPLEDTQNQQKIAYISDNAIIVTSACSQVKPDNLIFVLGGPFRNKESNYYGKSTAMPNFYIGKYEVTQKEWIEIMGSNPSTFAGDNLPVETVSWYDCVEYCNKRSIKEGLKPYYNIDKNKKDPDNKNKDDNIKWMITINSGADGYRLPTEAEWEYAASGGQNSNSYIYSGGNFADGVAWYWKNSGDKFLPGFWNRHTIENNHNKTKPVGGKESNELGLYDMSGNVREWCWDLRESDGSEPQGRVWKGGGWLGSDFCCELSFRASWTANSKSNDTGFRVCRGM